MDDATGLAEALLGLDGFAVLAVSPLGALGRSDASAP